jgi:hypothetical protein
LQLNREFSRKGFAMAARGEPYMHMLFQMLDGNDAGLLESAWKLVKPTKDTL